MPPKRQLPTTFDQWLGLTVENAARGHGGRPFLTGLLGWSQKSVERKTRGEAPFWSSELTIVAHALPGWTVEKLVTTALESYGDGDIERGVALTIAERAKPVEEPRSDAPASLEAHRAKKSPAQMTDDEIEAQQGAAGRDAELEQDDPEQP